MIRIFSPFLALLIPGATLAADIEPTYPAVPSFLGIPLDSIPTVADRANPAEVAAVSVAPEAIPVRPRSRPTADAAAPVPVTPARTRSLAPRPAAEAPQARRIFQMPWMTGVFQ